MKARMLLAVFMVMLGISTFATAQTKPAPTPAPSPPPAPAPAPPAAPAPAMEKLPSGEEVFDRYVEVTGGKAAYEKIKNRVATAEMAMPGMKATIKVTMAAPNLTLTSVEIPQMMKVEEGFDGEVAWEMNSMTGPRLVTGAELAQKKRMAQFNSECNWRDQYSKVEVVGTENVNGKKAYKSVATTKDGEAETHFHDVESGLLVKTIMKQQSDMGQAMVESLVSDYREVDGIKIPHKLVHKGAGQEFAMTFVKVEHNVELPASTFALPPQIQKLVEKSKTPGTPGAPGTPAPPGAPGTPPKKPEGMTPAPPK